MTAGFRHILIAFGAVIALAAIAFFTMYYTRIQTIGSIRKLTAYDDGYDLYRMDIKYDYSVDDVISQGITDNESFVNAVTKESLPLLPVEIQVPSFGCTAFSLTDSDGDIHMGRNYDS